MPGVYLAMAVQTLISAGTYLVAKAVMSSITPLEVAFFRFGGAAAAYAVVLVVLRLPLLPPPSARPRVLALAVLGLPLNQGLLLSGLSRSTPSHAAILYALTPAIVLVLARAALGERISRLRVIGVAVAFTGVAIVLLERGLMAARAPLVGDLLILGAVLSWSMYTVLIRPLAVEHGAITATGWVLFWGGLLLTPLAPLALRPASALAEVPPLAWGGVAYLVLLTSVASYLLWGYALQHLQAAQVAIFSNLQPVTTAALSWLLLSERISPGAAVGGLLVIAGVYASQRG